MCKFEYSVFLMLDDFDTAGKSAGALYTGLAAHLAPDTPRYYDRKSGLTEEEYQLALDMSTTLYVGNLSFFTPESQIHYYFNLVAPVRRIVMGLNKKSQKPCGFAFVEYETRKEAERALDLLNAGKIDQRQIRIDWDWGFVHGR